MHYLRELALPAFATFFGTFAMLILSLAPTAQDMSIALILLPGGAANKAMHNFAELDVPIRDIRWRGSLVEFDIRSLTEAQRKELFSQLPPATLRIAVRSGAICNARSTDRGIL